MTDRRELIDCLATEAFQVRGPGEEPFLLSSGGTSQGYVDCRGVLRRPGVLAGVVGLIGEHLRSFPVLDGVAGVSMGADPLVFGVAGLRPQAVGGWYALQVRKYPKTHGHDGRIEWPLGHLVGPWAFGDHVVLLQDVVTSGASAARAIQWLTDAGVAVLGVVAVLDRERGGMEVLREVLRETVGDAHPSVTALVRMSEVRDAR